MILIGQVSELETAGALCSLQSHTTQGRVRFIPTLATRIALLEAEHNHPETFNDNLLNLFHEDFALFGIRETTEEENHQLDLFTGTHCRFYRWELPPYTLAQTGQGVQPIKSVAICTVDMSHIPLTSAVSNMLHQGYADFTIQGSLDATS
jgi:hypothetical protein